MIKRSITPKNPNNLTIKNGDYTILFSETFNMYEDTLSIYKLFNINMFFSFEEDKEDLNYRIQIISDESGLKFKFLNFHKNPLGVCTTEIVKLNGVKYSEEETTVDGEKSEAILEKDLYFSAHIKNVSTESNFFMFSLSFYFK